jgi:hypothetical protein
LGGGDRCFRGNGPGRPDERSTQCRILDDREEINFNRMTTLLKRSILALAFALACVGSGFATRVTITGGVVDQYHGPLVPSVARLESDREFSDSTGVRVPAGSGYSGFGQQFTVVIDGSGAITISSGTAYSTDDSSDPRTRYTLAIYDSFGRLIRRLFATKGLIVPHTPNPTTWDALRVASEAATIVPAPTYPTVAQVNSLISAAIAATPTSDLLIQSSSDLDSAISTANANPTLFYTGKVIASVTISAAKTVPSNLELMFTGLGKLVKSASGTVTFQGVGLRDPESRTAVFSGFSSGNISWSSVTLAPRRISGSLWADTVLSTRLISAIAAMNGKNSTIVAYPGNIAAKVTVTTGLSLYLTKGNYTISASDPPFVLQSATRFYGDGQGQTILNESAATAVFIRASGVETSPFAGYNENILVDDITFKGNPATVVTSADSAILLGNVHNGTIRNCTFDHTHGFAAYIGGFGTSGNTANGFWIVDNIMDGLQTQQVGTIGGKNGWIQRNVFLVSPPDTAPNMSVIDIEPNSSSDGSENLFITDNIIDSRGSPGNSTRPSPCSAGTART